MNAQDFLRLMSGGSQPLDIQGAIGQQGANQQQMLQTLIGSFGPQVSKIRQSAGNARPGLDSWYAMNPYARAGEYDGMGTNAARRRQTDIATGEQQQQNNLSVEQVFGSYLDSLRGSFGADESPRVSSGAPVSPEISSAPTEAPFAFGPQNSLENTQRTAQRQQGTQNYNRYSANGELGGATFGPQLPPQNEMAQVFGPQLPPTQTVGQNPALPGLQQQFDRQPAMVSSAPPANTNPSLPGLARGPQGGPVAGPTQGAQRTQGMLPGLMNDLGNMAGMVNTGRDIGYDALMGSPGPQQQRNPLEYLYNWGSIFDDVGSAAAEFPGNYVEGLQNDPLRPAWDWGNAVETGAGAVKNAPAQYAQRMQTDPLVQAFLSLFR